MFTPFDGMRVIPCAASPESEVSFAGHLILFFPLHPTVSVYRIDWTPVPCRFDGALEFLGVVGNQN